MEKNDLNAASFAYSINMLRLLLQMQMITEEEYKKIANISADYYGVEIIIFN